MGGGGMGRESASCIVEEGAGGMRAEAWEGWGGQESWGGGMGGTALLSFYPPERHQLKAPLARDLVAPCPAMPPCTVDYMTRDFVLAYELLQDTIGRVKDLEDPPRATTVELSLLTVQMLLSKHVRIPIRASPEMTLCPRHRASESGAAESGASSSSVRRSHPY